MAFTVRFGRGRDDRQHGAGRRAANIDESCPTFSGGQQVAFFHAEAGEGVGRQSKQVVGPWVRVALGDAVGVVEVAVPTVRHEADGLDTDVSALRQP